MILYTELRRKISRSHRSSLNSSTLFKTSGIVTIKENMIGLTREVSHLRTKLSLIKWSWQLWTFSIESSLLLAALISNNAKYNWHPINNNWNHLESPQLINIRASYNIINSRTCHPDSFWGPHPDITLTKKSGHQWPCNQSWDSWRAFPRSKISLRQ